MNKFNWLYFWKGLFYTAILLLLLFAVSWISYLFLFNIPYIEWFVIASIVGGLINAKCRLSNWWDSPGEEVNKSQPEGTA